MKNGLPLTLLSVAALAAAGAVRRRGSVNQQIAWWGMDASAQGRIWIHPLDFLRLTSTPADSSCLSSTRVDTYADAMRRGDRFRAPHLSISPWRDSPDRVAVASHDGRHRSLSAHHLGAKRIPVDLFVDEEPVPLDRILSGEPVRWLSQYYDDEEVESCGFTPDEEFDIRNLEPEMNPYLPLLRRRGSRAKAGPACPAPTQDIALNTSNRDRAIRMFDYGPPNPAQPSNWFWKKIASRWSKNPSAEQIAETKTMRCGNCGVFDVSPTMKACMPRSYAPDAYEAAAMASGAVLGYCWAHSFKCASTRTCATWVQGPAISTDERSPLRTS